MQNTLRFEIVSVSGMSKEYENNNQQDFMFDFISELWQDIAKKEFDHTGIYVSAVIMKSKAVYSEEKGCPKGGENTFVITGAANKEVVIDIDEWKAMVIRLAQKLKEELKQSVVICEFLDAEMHYL
ncbi:hypothetical protein [Clostridium felsineum]|uniref:Uncharacterized protein n=1 Tax=Clostridium felsineum TaxID=36839 RepID=A0A1S8KXB2_9CLOT|nr:hypothetical protein [Clostridium felsineum]URZ04934.1 hypothetical protein CLROS_002580 [Clostridium felsineum]URZ09975.1 hypothetical protein CROST_006830 [Clostridium felsineum]